MKEILFASRKGGTGKSTLCAMVANHLSFLGKNIIVVDCDNCSTLTWKRKSDKKNILEQSDIKYEIISFEDYSCNREKYSSYDYVLIDNYSIVCQGIPSVVVIPFIYTEMVLDSTFRFIKSLRQCDNIEICFVPNEVNGYKQAIKKKDTIDTVNWILGIFGKILPKVCFSRLLEQVNTINNTVDQNNIVRDFIDTLLPESAMSDTELQVQPEEDGHEETPSDEGSELL